MKIVHCADLHLGSKIQAKLSEKQAEERRGEVRQAFTKMLKAAENYGAKIVLISGDAFDSDRPSMRDKQFFYRTIEEHHDLTFFYLRGNHDSFAENTLTEKLPNLHSFGDTWTEYSVGNICIAGAEWAAKNAENLYNTLQLDENKINIVLLHGDIQNEIDLRRFKNKNINYLALGHIHSFSQGALDERGVYAYSGCLEGRGYDECGKKGFVLLDIPENEHAKIGVQFVPSSLREITEYTVDISGAKDDFEACRMVQRAITSPSKDLVRVYLTGEVSFDRHALKKSVEEALKGEYFHASVKDETKAKCDFAAIKNESSLQGEFVRITLERNDLTPEQKDAIIRLGIGALNDKEATL